MHQVVCFRLQEYMGRVLEDCEAKVVTLSQEVSAESMHCGAHCIPQQQQSLMGCLIAVGNTEDPSDV